MKNVLTEKLKYWWESSRFAASETKNGQFARALNAYAYAMHMRNKKYEKAENFLC